MKKTTLTEAVGEAERFLAAAQRLEEAYGKCLLPADDPDHERFLHYPLDLAAYTADVRRKSMDLTKALARLRKNE